METIQQERTDEGTSTSTQSPPNTTIKLTQPLPTRMMHSPVITSPATTTSVTTLVSTPATTAAAMTSIPTPPPLVQKVAPTITPTTERVIIHNIELNFNQEDQQPIMHSAQKKVEKKKRKKLAQCEKQSQVLEKEQVDPMEVDEQNPPGDQPVDKEKEQDEPDEEHDERFVLTPEVQQNLFKEIVGEGALKQIEETNKGFVEKVNEKLEELQQQQLNVDSSLQENLNQQILPTQEVQIPQQEQRQVEEEDRGNNQEEEKDEEEEQLQKAHKVIVEIVAQEDDKD